ncbi:MAG: M15 family metallopeptidase [Lachnospiraceae bacterium]|nr:M15 family metallopeptidase [Lachnospiraceae bacterium]
MNVTFKDKVLSLYRRTIRKHKLLKIPMLVLSVILLFLDHVARRIQSGARRYIAVLASMTFAFVSCSFSSVIWGEGEYDFTADVTSYYYETEESAAAFAVEDEVDTELIDADDSDDDDLIDPENIKDISELDTVSGADIIGSIDDIDISADEEMPVDEAQDDHPDFSRDDWQLVLVNKNHPIAEDYSFTLGTIKGAMQCDERILADLYAMLEGALKDGVNLVICSPYRNDDRQQMLFDRKVDKYTAQGMSYMEAYKTAAQAVTIPGSSEHQIGLAIDMVSDSYVSLNEGFGDTTAGQWLAAHSYEYGFVIRYPEGKEDITGIEYEPWHLRYVGKNAAKVLYEEDLTLEEFWEKYL